MDDVVWTEHFPVRAGETDLHGRVSVAALCSYLQEAASNQAHALQFSVAQLPGRTWVLVRLHLKLDAYPAWRDTVRVETWPSGIQGRYALREYLLFGGQGEPFGRATSGWVMIDVAARRPVRFPDALAALPATGRERAIADEFDRLPAVAAEVPRHELLVRPSDLDMNRHVNHVRYIVWALDSLPEPWLQQQHRLTSLEVHFRAETTAAAVVGVQAQPDTAPGVWLHRVFHVDDGRDAALLRTHWRQPA